MAETKTREELRRDAVVRSLVVLALVVVVVVSFTVLFAASGAIRWVAGVVAGLAVLATLAAAVRLFVALSLLLDPPRGRG